MIDIEKLTSEDIGRWVIYSNSGYFEIGKIKFWNFKYVFVVYKCDNNWENFILYTATATAPKDLDFIKNELDF